jgi:hypothetical protein
MEQVDDFIPAVNNHQDKHGYTYGGLLKRNW